MPIVKTAQKRKRNMKTVQIQNNERINRQNNNIAAA
jgi:hypothetical protein